MQTHLRRVRRIVHQSILAAAPAAVILMLVAGMSLAAGAATLLSELWTAGGLSAGTDSAGQAARIGSDASGNVAVISGPSGGRDLAVTSYTADGTLRWRSTVTPALGTFVGDWVVAAPNEDLVVIGHNQDSHGRPIANTMLRYNSNGTLLWRVDFSASFFPAVARLVVDAAGNAYVAWSAVGSGLFVQKYSPAGTLLWSQSDSTTGGGYAFASSLALSPDGVDVAVTGSVSGGAAWITAVYDAATGVRRWQATAGEGTVAKGVVVDTSRVYVTGQGVTGAGTPALAYYLTVVAYDRATGARLWRRDKKPADAYDAAGLWTAMAPDGSLVVTGQTNRGFLDWYTVAFETTGAVRWEAVRDGGLNTDEIPSGVLVLEDGTTVVTGKGGPNLAGGYIPGVTAGYSSNGELRWEAFSRMATVWATALPSGDVCAAGGYDAFITCWRVGTANQPPTAVVSALPATGVAPLSVAFDGSRSTDIDGTIASWAWSFGDGTWGSGPLITHVYSTAGSYVAKVTVTDNGGASNTTSVAINVTAGASSVPTAPTNLAASSNTRARINLTWINTATNATSITVQRCGGSTCASFVAVAQLAATARSWTDTGVKSRSTYRYRVSASNAVGESPYSNIAGAKAR
jgi:PKD repeat protein